MEGTVKHKLPPETSVFSAELWAILQAIQLIGDLNTKKNIIFSDSESALEALSNESADAAAKQAAIEGYKPPFKIPYEDLLTESTEQAKRQSEESMKIISKSKGTLYYENFYNASSNKTWFHGANLSRNEIVMINRLRSNHINVNESLHRVNMVESPACPCGDPRQSINHLIFHCETFNSNSSPIRNYIAQKFPDPSPNLLPALRSPSPKLCRLLLAFMKANELFF
ncbi:PREDICTED: uncharacterized protein LOC108768366 [Trachymyrmex cornetzi]|uniref:uncharacterized protein LOC108768366 n=1 Tax=Trachymyrmex cornetzi TaxID=471704 RepID=UPI00084F41F5|nr:PREDICTED: uncharacterized protein LOC108768366 [Trachymyrmex cornetzi]